MGKVLEMIWGEREAEYFCKQDWTAQISLKSRNKSTCGRTATRHTCRSDRPLAKRFCHIAEAVERQLQAFHDLGRDFVGGRQQIGIVERVILDPENVEIDLVACQQGFERKTFEFFGFLALGPVARAVAGDEIIEISPYHRALFQREALVGAQVVNPEILCC